MSAAALSFDGGRPGAGAELGPPGRVQNTGRTATAQTATGRRTSPNLPFQVQPRGAHRDCRQWYIAAPTATSKARRRHPAGGVALRAVPLSPGAHASGFRYQPPMAMNTASPS